MQVVPDFFIVGSVKCGTTWLLSRLSRLPSVYCSDPKEPHYFSQAANRKRKSYMRHVRDEEEYVSLFRGARADQLKGEASASYLWSDVAIPRIKQANPQARIVAILRDPIDRAYSHYLMDVREGVQDLSFYEALKEDEAVADRQWHAANLYVDLGLYTHQVKRLQSEFPPAQVLILCFEDLKADPKAFLDRVTSFLALPAVPDEQQLREKSNEYRAPRTKLAGRVLGSETVRHAARFILPHSLRAGFKNRVLLAQERKPPLAQDLRSYLAERLYPQLDGLQGMLDFEVERLRLHL